MADLHHVHLRIVSIRSAEGGLIVAVCGTMSDDAAAQLAACRRDQCQGIALLLAVSSWAEQPSPGASGNGSLAAGPASPPATARRPGGNPGRGGGAARGRLAGGHDRREHPAGAGLAAAARFADQAGGGRRVRGDPSLRTV